jgi:3-deoxy-D-manno-octulosonic-acid transferase
VRSIVDFAYYGALWLIWPYLLARVLPARGRRHLAGMRERLGACAPRQGSRPCIWIHGVSVGEIRAAAPLVAALEKAHPEFEVVLSTSTGTGQEVAKKSFQGKQVFYWPIDFSWAVRRVFERVRPDLVILVELEIWPNFLGEAFRRRVPVVLANGRISEKSYRGYKLVRSWLFDPIGRLARFCVQTDVYADRFRRLGIPPELIEVTGSVKYDQLSLKESDGPTVRREVGVGEGEVVLLGGSTHPGEERALLKAYAALRARVPGLRLILVPRHTERTRDVQREVGEAGAQVVLRTERLKSRSTEPLPAGAVLLVDTIGELGRLYGAADVVFVGGSLIPHGGQNILEPVAIGKPTVFGPSYENFKEPVDRLLAAGGARLVAGEPELERSLAELLADPTAAKAMGERGRQAILAARGATDRTIRVIGGLIAERSASGRWPRRRV